MAIINGIINLLNLEIKNFRGDLYELRVDEMPEINIKIGIPIYSNYIITPSLHYFNAESFISNYSKEVPSEWTKITKWIAKDLIQSIW